MVSPGVAGWLSPEEDQGLNAAAIQIVDSVMVVLSVAAGSPGALAADPQVDLKTNLGTIRIELYPAKAPKTVENFLQYVKDGYYTGTIFEIEHPESGSSIGGGGRYDGMVGRWLGTDAPAVGISIGFERAVDLVEANVDNSKSLVLVLDSAEPAVIGNALNVQQQAIEAGYRVRLEQRPKKLNNLLDSMSEQGFGSFATIGEEFVNFADLSLRNIAN